MSDGIQKTDEANAEMEMAERLHELEAQKNKLTDQAVRVRAMEQDLCNEKVALQALLELSEELIRDQDALERDIEAASRQQDAFEEEIKRLEEEAAERDGSEGTVDREVLERMEASVDEMISIVNNCVGCNPVTGMGPLLDAHNRQLELDEGEVSRLDAELEMK